MEQAVYITRSDNVRYVTGDYSRLYFGHEFCQRLIPGEHDLAAMCDFIKQRKMSFTFVTPFVTDWGLEALRAAFLYMSRNCPDAEIVVNDLGVLKILVDEYGFRNLVLGRLLAKQKKGPRIMKLLQSLPLDAADHFRRSSSDAVVLRDYFKKMHIGRLEFDNLLQGIERDSIALKGSLYMPYGCISVTRYCLPAICSSHNRFMRSISKCNYECRTATFRLKNKHMPVDIMLKGNAQFFENRQIPQDLARLNIDRIVFEPEIPV